MEAESVSAQLGRADHPVFATGMDGRIVSWNAAAARELGVPAWRATGAPCWRVVGGLRPGGGPLCEAGCPMLDQARHGESPAPCEMLSAGRHFRVLHLTLRSPGGGPPAVLVHVLDDLGPDRAARKPRVPVQDRSAPGPRLASVVPLTRRESLFGKGARGRAAALLSYGAQGCADIVQMRDPDA